MKFKVYVNDIDSNEQSENVVEVRKNTTMKTVALKGIEKHADNYAADPLDFMNEIKSLHREAYDLTDFVEWLKQDLDLQVTVTDLNDYKFYNTKEDYYITSYDLGLQSYAIKWAKQLVEKDAVKDFKNYTPDFETVVECGNKIASEKTFLEEWEKEEWS